MKCLIHKKDYAECGYLSHKIVYCDVPSHDPAWAGDGYFCNNCGVRFTFNGVILEDDKENENKWLTLEKTITINQDTLKHFNSYVDFLHLNNEHISIRLIIKNQPEEINYVNVNNRKDIGRIVIEEANRTD